MTIRKQILEAMAAAVSPAPLLGGRIFRSRAAVVERGECPCLLIRPAGEAVNPQGELAERDFMVDLIVIARGEVPDDVADDVIGQVHDLLCADPSFGGLAAQLFEESSVWTFADADNGACDLRVRYRVRYYTPEDSLTRPLV